MTKKVRLLNQLTNLSHRDRLQGSIIFLDFDMLDAMTASAMNKLLNTQTQFRKRASVEEQRAQKNTTDSYVEDRLRT